MSGEGGARGAGGAGGLCAKRELQPDQLDTGDVILKINGTDVNRFTNKEGTQTKVNVRNHMSSPADTQGDVNFEYILPSERKNNKNIYEQQSSHYLRNAKTNHYSSSSPSPEQNSLVNSTDSPPSSTSRCNRSPRLSHSDSAAQSNGCSDKSSNGCGDWSEKSSNGCAERTSSNGWCSEGKDNDLGSSGRLRRNQHPSSAPISYNNTKPVKQKFEAYMMTGELMLKLSRTERSGEGVVGDIWNPNPGPPAHPHRHHHAPRHRAPDYDMNTYNSTPVSPIDTRTSVCLGSQVQRYNSTPVTSSLDCQGTRCSEPTVTDPTYTYNSTPTSPCEIRCGRSLSPTGVSSGIVSPIQNTHPLGCVRTSRSEDHLQFQKESSMSAVAIDIDDDDVTSSLNTLLDTRPDRGSTSSRQPIAHATDRIVWTYNAPVSSSSEKNPSQCNGSNSTTATSNSTSASEGISPQRSLSPASPTSVSSSVMSSASVSSRTPPSGGHQGDPSARTLPHPQHSISEAVSNISSPDYQDQGVDMFNGRECMEVSDPSDSDSTILVSEPCNKRVKSSQGGNVPYMTSSNPESNSRQYDNYADQSVDHRIVIQVKGPDKQDRLSSGEKVSPTSLRNSPSKGNNGDPMQQSSESQLYNDLRDEDMCGGSACSSPEDACSEADADSLHSFHYSPKAVDIPSAIRLAKRLYGLDGFKKSDVSRHLSKNNDFSKAVAEEYLRYFTFERDTLDGALRKFLRQFCLTGETQERERVLVHFSRRYLDCNPGSFNSQDAVHTLTCAIMLLNTDLHSQSASRKMSCAEFIENLAELNDGDNFPREVLKALYQAIKTHPLEWALDTEPSDNAEGNDGSGARGTEAHPVSARVGGTSFGSNPFLEVPDRQNAVEFKKGYVMRKCCYDANAKKTPFGKRSWKMFYCTLRDLILYLHKDEHGFRKSQMSDNLHNAIRIHHALATKAVDYTKKQHVFRLQTADQAEYLFQTSDSKELQSWIDTINLVCASFSAQPLAGAVGSQRKFQRPLLPCSHTKLNLRDQLRDHDERCTNIETELVQIRASGASHHNREREAYLHSELKRYKTYAYLLRSRVSQWGADGVATAVGNAVITAPILGELDESEVPAEVLRPPPLPERNPPPSSSAPNSRDLPE